MEMTLLMDCKAEMVILIETFLSAVRLKPFDGKAWAAGIWAVVVAVEEVGPMRNDLSLKSR